MPSDKLITEKSMVKYRPIPIYWQYHIGFEVPYTILTLKYLLIVGLIWPILPILMSNVDDIVT